jgi:hypothetical protein
MEDVGSDATYDTVGVALSCASFLNHSCVRLIKRDAALVISHYADALVYRLTAHTEEACSMYAQTRSLWNICSRRMNERMRTVDNLLHVKTK